jgi:hypothetical protein
MVIGSRAEPGIQTVSWYCLKRLKGKPKQFPHVFLYLLVALLRLETIYKEFDKLAYSNNVFKVETVGDVSFHSFGSYANVKGIDLTPVLSIHFSITVRAVLCSGLRIA